MRRWLGGAAAEIAPLYPEGFAKSKTRLLHPLLRSIPRQQNRGIRLFTACLLPPKENL
jgi:hypothetical protein